MAWAASQSCPTWAPASDSEVPLDAGLQRGDVHVLHLLERADDDAAVLGPGGDDREAAVPGHHGRHPVEARRRQLRVPEHLGVVVRVDVDESRRHDVPGGVEHGVALEAVADGGDASPVDGDIGAPPNGAGAVEHRATSNHQFGHESLPLTILRLYTRYNY